MNKEDFDQVAAALVNSLCGAEEDVWGQDNQYVGTVEVDSTWGKEGLVEGRYEKGGLVHYFSLTLALSAWEAEIE